MARKAKFKPNENVTYSGHTGECSLFVGSKGQYIYRNNPVVDLRNAAGELIAKAIAVTHVERLPELGVAVQTISRDFQATALTKLTTVINTAEASLNKYERQIINAVGESITVDVYDVLDAFNVTDAAVAHAIKKLLAPGQRGNKTVVQDLQESIASVERAIDRQHSKHLRG